jgi:hypothetical protein
MAVDASRLTLSNSYIAIAGHGAASGVAGDQVNRRVLIKNVTATATIYIGGETDAVGQRFAWEPLDGPLSIDFEPDEELWGVSDGDDQVLHIISNGR